MGTTFESYFRYHLKSKLRWLIILVVIALFFTVIYSTAGQRTEYMDYDWDTGEMIHTGRFDYESFIGWPVTLLMLCAYILPVTEFAFFKKRRNLDCVYALPISRRQLGTVHYLTGLICLVLPYVSSYLVNFLLMLRYPEGFNYSPLLGHFLYNLLIGITIYSLMVFLFNQANTMIDGIIFMVLWTFLLSIILGAVNNLSQIIFVPARLEGDAYNQAYNAWRENWRIEDSYGITWSLPSDMNWPYSRVIEKAENATLADFWDDSTVVWSVIWPMLGAAAAAGFFWSFGQRRAEKTEEVSDSWFGYKLLIPLYSFGSLIAFSGATLFSIGVPTFVGYIIYRRGFRLKVSDWIIVGIYVNLSLLYILVMFLLEI